MENSMGDWREPYRTMDESGSPGTAAAVGWNWINEIALAQVPSGELRIDDSPPDSSCKVTRLYHGTTLLAATTTFRDDMNFTVLLRWKSPSLTTQPPELTDGV